jgi:hypothetical protein
MFLNGFSAPHAILVEPQMGLPVLIKGFNGMITTDKFQIPPDLVVKTQAVDIAEIILSLIRRPNVVQMSYRNKKSRFELLSTSDAYWFTTKSDGM